MSPLSESSIQQIRSENDIFRKSLRISELLGDDKIRVKDIASALNISPSYVCSLVRLQRLPELVRDGYYTGNVKQSHLFTLARLHSQEDMIAVYEETIAQGLSVGALDAKVRHTLHSVATEGDYLSEDILAQLVQDLKDGDEHTDVRIYQSRIRAKITIALKGSTYETSKRILALTKKLRSKQE